MTPERQQVVSMALDELRELEEVGVRVDELNGKDLPGNRYYSSVKWTPRHRLVVALHLAGYRNNEIAKITNLSESRVSIILNDVRAQKEIRELSTKIASHVTDVHLRLHLLSNDALSEVEREMRHSPDERIRQRAAFGILDRAGFVSGGVSAGESTQISDEIASRIEEALAEGEEAEEISFELLEAEFDFDEIEEIEETEEAEEEFELSASSVPSNLPSTAEREGFADLFSSDIESDDD